MEVNTEELLRTVEHQHHCKARLVQSAPVKETHGEETVWEGVVHIFEIYGHDKATIAYAWSSPIEGSDKRRFFAVLHQGPVKSPVDAVRAAIVAEQRQG
jgi:arginine utilization protein RocB